MVSIQRPTGINVGVYNPSNTVYIKGNETTDGSVMVKVTLTSVEMTGSKINIIGIDQTTISEWQDLIVSIDVPTGNVETLTDLDEGDRIETNSRLIINKAGTTTPILDKKITGSLLRDGVTITTKDS